MKVVILAGGLGSRLGAETEMKPKPMIEIGGRPILWHIMKLYAHAGFTEFIICLGYKGYVIKEYFANYFLHQSDITVDLATNSIRHHRTVAEPWKVTLVDTGIETLTAGRLKRVRKHLGAGTFMMTYGDGVADIDLSKLLAFHRAHGRLATVTSVQPIGRFGTLKLGANNAVLSFEEKPKGERGWINGGFFVLETGVLDYIKGDETSWEREPLEALARARQLRAFRHDGFWQPMDTAGDRAALDALWRSGKAPWKVWEKGQ